MPTFDLIWMFVLCNENLFMANTQPGVCTRTRHNKCKYMQTN